MDSRDIKEEPQKIVDGSYLDKIYDLQKVLLSGYINIEGLPEYPININTKKNQSLIKDFVGRVIEELAESFESLIFIDDIMQETKYLTFCRDYKEELVKLCNHLQNANEELADALHFMVELLIYSNIQPEDIDKYINKKVETLGKQVVLSNTNTLQRALDFGYYWIQDCTPYIDDISPINIINIIHRLGVYNDAYGEKHDKVDVDFRLIPAAHKYNRLRYISYKSVMWDISYHLNIARNYLKNKPWKRSQMMTDEVRFQEEVVKAFVSMMGLFKYMGIENANEVYFIYFKKNLVNQFRQKSNY